MEEYKIDMRYRQMFYKKNPQFIKYIRDFLKLNNLYRCLLVDKYFVYTDKLSKYGYPFTNRIDTWTLENSTTIHYFNHSFDKGIIKNNYVKDISNHYTGVKLTADIDSQKDEELSKIKKKSVRVDILSDDKYLNEMEQVINNFYDEAKDRCDIDKDELELQFSGNGFYIRPKEVYYGTVEQIAELEGQWLKLIMRVNENGGGCKIDDRSSAWNRFFKCGFSFHSTYNRLSIPVNIKDLNLEYLIKYSNPDNYLKGEMIK